MIIIIIGVLLFILCVRMVGKRVKWWVPLSFLIVGIICLMFGMLVPLNGYNEYAVREEIILSPIGVNKENNTDIYIIELENGNKIYKSSSNNGKIESILIYDKSAKVEILEKENCNEAKFVYYFRPMKPSVFSLGMISMGEKYVFYVPKDSVIK